LATAVMFAPCPNITSAARQIAQLIARCKTLSQLKVDPIYCAIAAYRGSWDRPAAAFAEAVRATVEKGDAPNFDMPKDAYFDATEIAAETPAAGPNAAATPAPAPSDDRERGWLSALFPAKPPPFDTASVDSPNDNRSAEEPHSPGPANATPATVNSLFVPRSFVERP
jgi:hypothetical protein